MLILAIGDVIGKPGRQALNKFLPQIKQEYGVDLTIVNAENSAHGIGVTPETAAELFKAGADVLTSGNHVWAQKIYSSLSRQRHAADQAFKLSSRRSR